MNSFERLEDEARKDGIDVIQKKFRSRRIKGLYSDGIIGINDNVKTSVEKTCVLSEELGHHHTSVGNIIDMTSAGNRKQERQARMWGYNKLIGLFNGLCFTSYILFTAFSFNPFVPIPYTVSVGNITIPPFFIVSAGIFNFL